MEMNGGSVIAMTGKNCVAIASDLRLGQQAVGLSADFEKVSFVSREASLSCSVFLRGGSFSGFEARNCTRPHLTTT